MDEILWQTKLAARLHDPVEKALILMRTPEGHEAGTSAALRKELGIEPNSKVTEAVRRADRWAAAADRAAFPNREGDKRYPSWQRVHFHQRPVILHPLTGVEFDLASLGEVEPEQAKALALDHLRGLIHEDLRRTALAFWRFGPEIDAEDIKSLWSLLPADTRVPDHSIHDHLDLTAALASAFAVDSQGPALLAVSLGPVQSFISASRSTSDLWAGSHLLSSLAWEAMRVVCERLGPEAILFPRLRGLPQVDLWLRDEMKLREALFASCSWTRLKSDSNPLFVAALPNRFTALVPASMARELAEHITQAVRGWALEHADLAYRELLKAAGLEDAEHSHGYRQIREQLAGFPEVHWAVVPWSLADADGGDKVQASTPSLRAAMCEFFESDPPGYLGTRAWKLISGGLKLDEGWFWQPNPGTLYPALHELLDRAFAAAKAVRPFDQMEQVGWRDSLTGEAEWLTHDREQLKLPPGQRTDTLWTRVAQSRPAWAKRGEHLPALGALKRLWPTLFVRKLRALDLKTDRFVVSSHTMAIVTSLVRAVEEGHRLPDALRAALENADAERVALPKKLNDALHKHPDGALLRRLPAWLDQVRDADDDAAEQGLKALLGDKPETYYGLLLMDGDNMGAWLSAESRFALTHKTSFHPQIRAGLERFKHDAKFSDYAKELRASSPSRHMAISEALNNFSVTLAPAVAEEHFNGKVLYAGGDDLMAMFPVIDLLPAMAALRAAYSGIEPAAVGLDKNMKFQNQGNGFVRYKDRLLRVMGERATASMGAVIAHCKAPLAAVMRELHAAEQRAKDMRDKDAFSLTIVKRSGGALRLTAPWGEPIRLLLQLRDLLADKISRRAVYNSAIWLRDLPEPDEDGNMVAQMLAYQFYRQSEERLDRAELEEIASRLIGQAMAYADLGARRAWIENFLSVAEFLARESRHPAIKEGAA